MDDALIQESLAGFDSVWQRVARRGDGPETPNTPVGAKTYSQEDALLGFIHEETCAAASASSLARMFQGDGRAVLQRQAVAAQRHLRRLRAEYFILTGVTCGANEDCRSTNGKLASLRSFYLQACELAERYTQAAEKAGDEALQGIFLAFAEDEHRHAQEARSLLIDNF